MGIVLGIRMGTSGEPRPGGWRDCEQHGINVVLSRVDGGVGVLAFSARGSSWPAQGCRCQA